MKRVLWTLLPVLAVSLALPVFAGGDKCTADTQACLDGMTAKMADKGWIGIKLDWNEETHNGTIKEVVHGSPAEAAGLQTGDVYAAIEGVKLGSEDEMAWQKIEKKMTAGNIVHLTILRDGHEKDVAVTLAAMPEEVMAAQIGYHMMQHAHHEGTNAEEE